MDDIDELVDELGKLIADRLGTTPLTFMLVVTDEETMDRAYCTMSPPVAKDVISNVLAGILAGQHKFLGRKH